jgi:hypothetical protein
MLTKAVDIRAKIGIINTDAVGGSSKIKGKKVGKRIVTISKMVAVPRYTRKKIDQNLYSGFDLIFPTALRT